MKLKTLPDGPRTKSQKRVARRGLITTIETAKILGISRVQVNNLIRSGVLSGKLVGVNNAVSLADVEAAKSRPDRGGRLRKMP